MSRSHLAARCRSEQPADDRDTIGASSKQFSDNQSTDARSASNLMTIAEAARFLRVSISSLRRLQQGRHIPFIKVGGSVRFARNDLLAYIEKRRVRPVDELQL